MNELGLNTYKSPQMQGNEVTFAQANAWDLNETELLNAVNDHPELASILSYVQLYAQYLEFDP